MARQREVVRTTTVEKTTILPAPPGEAFAAVNSPDVAPVIDPAVRMWKPDSEPIRVGTRFTIRGRLGIIPIRGTTETTTWDPPHLARYRSVSPTWPFRMTAEHRFDPEGTDRARYTWTINFHEVNVVARPLIALAANVFRRATRNQANALSAYLAGDAHVGEHYWTQGVDADPSPGGSP
jgi:hypothetical protein